VKRVAVFGLVGVAASVVHYLVALLAMRLGAGTIFLANLAGFALAFAVSYVGHYHLTFASGAAHRQALPRFLATALVGLGVNNLVLGLLVWAAGAERTGFIAVAILAAAGSVYVLSRGWAFAGLRGPGSPGPS
jgi:putative flippase GtrA